MQEKGALYAPVMEGQSSVAGVILLRDLRVAGAVPFATISLSQIVTRSGVTLTEDTPLEEAARLLAVHGVCALPVVDWESPVGLFTEVDVQRGLQELVGGGPGVLLTVMVPAGDGRLAAFTAAIFAAGAQIVGLNCRYYTGKRGLHWRVFLKLQGLSKEQALAVVQPLVALLADAREM
jgi:acetoin utilization protein AcuB